ncbi:GIY-YIG nuclease family protein [Paenibacillus chitinolyticus]|uniref:GIY-YIG nuclease family protein n=1 Tax=Paenibacillus chitinolyticus TaxID=79263 RepID=UPI0036DD12B2
MFKKILEMLNLNKLIAEKTLHLERINKQIQEKEDVIQATIHQARESVRQEAEHILREARREADASLAIAKGHLADIQTKMEQELRQSEGVSAELESRQKALTKLEKTLAKTKSESLGIKNLVEKFPAAVKFEVIEEELAVLEESLGEGALKPIVELHLHHHDSKKLRQEMSGINKEIKALLKSYEDRYTTKANKTIYHLMVIGLQAELQNILHTLSYTNLEKAVANASDLINKYQVICAGGNSQILPTITRFLSEIEPLFKNAILVEYQYFIQKEKEKEEQKLIREQMRQEAEEQRLLNEERKKIEQEEQKYFKEMEKNKEVLSKETDPGKIAALEARLRELEEQVQRVEEQKEEITKRANGRAGYVYVISNLGSFGDRMFKIGMTRRLNPLDRIEELGDASVPFKFDIHAMVFSENAVQLEQDLHRILSDNRVNKVNLRKEFFYSDIEGLQATVEEIDPTVEFITTMVAQEYRQSQSMDLIEEQEMVEAV